MSSRKIFILGVFFSIFFIACCGNNTGVVLQSTRVTDWGDWGEMENCPSGKFVTGMQLKVESDQGLTKDDTALNAVKFFCSNLNEVDGARNLKMANPITSAVGQWGFWRRISFCSEDFDLEDPLSTELTYKVAVGFRLRSEGIRNHRDDTAANNLILVCANVNPTTGEHGIISRLEGDGTRWGDWTDEMMCPAKYAICGLATQIENSKGRRHDDTALNNLDVECCPLPTLSDNKQETFVTTSVVGNSSNNPEFTTTTRKSVSAEIEDESPSTSSVYEQVYDNEDEETEIEAEAHPQQSTNKPFLINKVEEDRKLSTESRNVNVPTYFPELDATIITKHELWNPSQEITTESPIKMKTASYVPQRSENGIVNDVTEPDPLPQDRLYNVDKTEKSTTLVPIDLETNYESEEMEIDATKVWSTRKSAGTPPSLENTIGENSELQDERPQQDDYDYSNSVNAATTPSETATKLSFVFSCVWLLSINWIIC